MNKPMLIILCGLPGAGKTSYAEKLLKDTCYGRNTIRLSSDKIRQEFWGSESMQGDNNQVFSLMQSRAVDALNNGQNVIYDSTGITRKDRAGIIAACPKFVKIACHIVWAPVEVCIERDAARERTVGKEVIDRMLRRFQAPFFDEGIDEIWVHNTCEDFDVKKYFDELVDNMKIPHDNPHHTLDVFNHCIEAAKYVEKLDSLSPVWFAAILHDAAKPNVKAFVDSKNNPCEQAHYYGHQCYSAYLFYGLNGCMGFSCDDFLLAAWLVSTHMDPFLNTKYYNKLPAYLKKQVDLLHTADLEAH